MPWGLIAPTEASHGPFSILLRRVLFGGGLFGLDRSRLWQRLCSNLLNNLCSGILYGLGRADRGLRIFLGRPILELIEHGFGCGLIDFGFILKRSFKSGKHLVACRRFPCSRRKSWGVGG
jgi:hypothetical protein